MTVEVAVAGETLLLLPERAAYWVAERMLLVADPHFGKAATFRSFGIPVPHGTTADGLGRLDALLRRLDVRSLLFLGDFLHAKRGRSGETLGALAAWRRTHHDVEMTIVRGNHDREAGDVHAAIDVESLDPPLVRSPFAFTHVPTVCETGYAIGGHLHPAAVLVGAARQHVRLPCFWVRPRVAVLPAFGDFTGLWPVTPTPEDRVFVVAGNEVVER